MSTEETLRHIEHIAHIGSLHGPATPEALALILKLCAKHRETTGREPYRFSTEQFTVATMTANGERCTIRSGPPPTVVDLTLGPFYCGDSLWLNAKFGNGNSSAAPFQLPCTAEKFVATLKRFTDLVLSEANR